MTNHAIIQNMGFNPPTAKPCVMMREKVSKKNFFEYIAVYQDDLYIASPTSHPLSVWEQWMHLKIFLTL